MAHTQRGGIASTSALGRFGGAHSSESLPTSPLELLTRAKDKLRTLIDGGDIDSRPSRQGKEKQKVGACMACRQAKAKCTGEPGVTCPRCLAQPDIECVYPTFSKRGRKRGLTPNAILLDAAHSDLELLEEILANLAMNSALSPADPHPPSQQAAYPPPPAHPSPAFSTTYSQTSSGSGDRPLSSGGAGLATIMESPLAVLAHISSLEEVDGQGTDDEGIECPGSVRFPGQKKVPERYFAGGLYRSRYDTDPAMDPIHRGLLSEADLARLVALYFHSMWPLCWHLSPTIHSVRFLRDVSPFLTTVLAYQAALFCPVSGHLVQPLFAHVMHLAELNFSQGLKSLEIVQAYCLLLHWQPLAKSSSRDRQWSWLTMALSVATEIRLERPLDEATYLHYAHVTPLPEDSFTLLSDDRRRTWFRLFGAEIATCVETGRLKALTESSLFEDAWPKLVCQHAVTILLAVSLRFKGPAAPVLDQCKASAREVVRMAVEWPDSTLRFANNFIVVNIAYAATMLLRLSVSPTPGTVVHLPEEVRQISYQVADVLQRISDTRLHNASVATLHAARIRSLLVQLGTDAASAVPKVEPDLVDSSHALLAMGGGGPGGHLHNPQFAAPDWTFAPPANGGGAMGDVNGGGMFYPDLFHYDSMFRYEWNGNGSATGGGMLEGGQQEYAGSWP
ncbi:hypothetical protein RQP46_010537 [Phenoliferia psychrophenolica]